jgi:hypothetical protein
MSYVSCTCYRAWHSITPPPCPVHSARGVWDATYAQPLPGSSVTFVAIDRASRPLRCQGSHCAHTAACHD